MIIENDNVTALETGQLTVGTSVVQITSTKVTNLKRGIQVKAATDNTGIIYVSDKPLASASNGFPLSAQDGLLIPIDRLDKIFFISDTAAQVLAYILI